MLGKKKKRKKERKKNFSSVDLTSKNVVARPSLFLFILLLLFYILFYVFIIAELVSEEKNRAKGRRKVAVPCPRRRLQVQSVSALHTCEVQKPEPCTTDTTAKARALFQVLCLSDSIPASQSPTSTPRYLQSMHFLHLLISASGDI